MQLFDRYCKFLTERIQGAQNSNFDPKLGAFSSSGFSLDFGLGPPFNVHNTLANGTFCR